jgi:UDP-GlcNAc3NAcA epimerase
VETVEAGWNVLVGAEYGEILESIASFQDNSTQADIFGDGNASGKICDIIGK